jgi:hypothetical protein
VRAELGLRGARRRRSPETARWAVGGGVWCDGLFDFLPLANGYQCARCGGKGGAGPTDVL